MLFSFEETTNQYYIESQMNTPTIYRLLTGNIQTESAKPLKMDLSYKYVLVKREKTPIALISYRSFGSKAIEFHIIALEANNKLETAHAVTIEFIRLLKEAGKIQTLVTTVPEHSKHTRLLIAKCGFLLSGNVKNSTHYSSTLQNLIIYSREV